MARLELTHVTRVDVIAEGHTRSYLGVQAELRIQDDGQTLKVLITPHPETDAEQVRQQVVRGSHIGP